MVSGSEECPLCPPVGQRVVFGRGWKQLSRLYERWRPRFKLRLLEGDSSSFLVRSFPSIAPINCPVGPGSDAREGC
jgi:hypothetical protein